MPFGLTYAGFVVGIGLSMGFGPPDTSAPTSLNSLSLGTQVMPWVTPGQENMLTFTHLSDRMIWGKFTPISALGLSDKGTVFASWGLGRRLDVFGMKILPYTGPALYYDNNNNDILQFRTGFEIFQTLSENLTLTGGYYHISNGQANAPSADIDVAHVGVKLRF